MDKSLDVDDDDDMSPEALIMEATASSTIETEKQHREQELSSAADVENKKGAAVDASDIDSEEIGAAAVPPELSRTEARNLALQPGAYRGGGRQRTESSGDDSDLHDHSSYSAPSYYGVGLKTIVEATLVTESVEFGISRSEQFPAQDNTPVYKGEPMEERVKDSSEEDVVPISRKWIWWIALAACCLLVVTGVSVGVAVSLATENDTLTDAEKPATEGSQAQTQIVATLSPVDDPPANTTEEKHRPSLNDLMSRFDRITHHVALMHFASPTDTCSPLQDENANDPVVAGAVTVTCGDRPHQDRQRRRALQQYDGVVESAVIFVYDMNQCQHLGREEVRCLVDQSRKSILFTCGTRIEDYNGASYDANTTKTKTASVHVDETVATCNDNSNFTVYNSEGLDTPPVVAVFLTVGRLCQPTNNNGDDLFRSVNNTCGRGLNPVVSDVNNATYCIQGQKSCVLEQCEVQLDRMYTFDVNKEADCQAESLDNSVLYDDLIQGSINDEIEKLKNQQRIFVASWLNRWLPNA